MKIKNIALAISMAAVAVPAMAQYEGTTSGEQRIAEGKDVEAIKEKAYMFQEAFRNKNYVEAHESWAYLMSEAPYWGDSQYKNGAVMLYYLVKQETDAEKKKQYLDELIGLYDIRLKNLEGLNSFAKKKASRGDVLLSQAYYYDITGNGVDPEFNSYSVYTRYKEAMDAVRNEGGQEINGAYLSRFFVYSDALYKADKDLYSEQYLNDYLSSKEACMKVMQTAKDIEDEEARQKKLDEYDKPLQYIEGAFAASGAATPENLTTMYGPRIEEFKEDVNYLNNAINILYSNGCSETEEYYTACEYAYAIEPSYSSAIGVAAHAASLGDNAKATEYYNKAIEMSESNETKGTICLCIAQTLIDAREYDKATEYLDKVAEYNPELQGRVYYQHAMIQAYKNNADKSIEFFTKAAEADVTLAPDANRKKADIQNVIAQNKARAEAAARAKAQQIAAAKAAANKKPEMSEAQKKALEEYKKKKAAYDAAMAEYEKKMAAARKKAQDEENFWKGGK